MEELFLGIRIYFGKNYSIKKQLARHSRPVACNEPTTNIQPDYNKII